MFKKLTYLLLVFALLGSANSVQAVNWIGAVSRDWSDDGNWQGIGGEPDAPTNPDGSDAIDVRIYENPSTPLLNRPLIQAPNNEHTGGRFNLNGPLEMTGGTLTCWSRFTIGYSRAGPGEFTMRGGTVNIVNYFAEDVYPKGGRLSVGDESPATLNMYGGEINVTWPDGDPTPYYVGIHWPDGSGAGVINMFGGILRTSEVSWKHNDECIMVFDSSTGYPHGGKFIVKGDMTYPDPNYGNQSNSMRQKYDEGGIITNIPGDMINIYYDDVNDWTVVESVTKPLTPCDLYSDEIVDHLDLRVLVDKWLQRVKPGETAADLNQDNMVNFTDFAILAADWLESCPPL